VAALVGVTDCHVHINPVWEMREDARRIIGPGLSAPDLDKFTHDPSFFLSYLDRVGVDRAVLVNYVSPEIVGYTEQANSFVLDYAAKDPARLIAVGGFSPMGADPAATVERLAVRGIRGIKLHPPHQLVSPDGYRDGSAPRLREVYAAMERLGLPLLIHTGTSVFPRARNRFGQPLLVEEVAIDFPELTIVLAHSGRPLWMSEAVFLARRFPSVYLDISSIPPQRLLDYLPDLPKVIPKVLFGSDWPGPGVRDIGANLAQFRQLPLPPAALDAMLVQNPEHVFPRSSS
jgi:uncharacterized protein